MAKTGKQVQGDIYRLLRSSSLYSNISGEVYRNGMRPRDSKAEDAVVTFTAGLQEQFATGVVTINIYVPDIDPYGNGVLVEDSERTEDLEGLAQAWVGSLREDATQYKFSLQSTIYTEEEPTINQHFIVVKLQYTCFDNDY